MYELLFDDLRIDQDLLWEMNFEDLRILCDLYKNTNTKLLKKVIGQDSLLTIEEGMRIKRMHQVVDNGLHLTLGDIFREDRSPARRSAAVNLSLIRKITYNILRISMYETEVMDHFCDHEELREKYVFRGIVSRY